MKKDILFIKVQLFYTICIVLTFIFTGCKKGDSVISQNNELEISSGDFAKDKAMDTPITIIIEGTPHIYHHEQPSGGLEITIRCEEPYDRTCYTITMQDRDLSQYIRIESPTNLGILPENTAIPIKNVKFFDKSKSTVSFEVMDNKP